MISNEEMAKYRKQGKVIGISDERVVIQLPNGAKVSKKRTPVADKPVSMDDFDDLTVTATTSLGLQAIEACQQLIVEPHKHVRKDVAPEETQLDLEQVLATDKAVSLEEMLPPSRLDGGELSFSGAEKEIIATLEAQHAKLAPSSMKMFMECYASLLPPKHPLPERVSPYAEEGTKAHELFAMGSTVLMKEGVDAALMAVAEAPGYDAEKREHISDLIQLIDRIIKKIGKDCILTTLIEERVQFSTHIYGTIDFGILYVKDNKKKIYALDLKYGKGIAVRAEDNWQLMTYILAIINSKNWDATEAVAAIYQPRNRDEHADPLEQWTIDQPTLKKARANLKRFEKMALKVQAGTKKPKEHFGPQCTFCKRKAECKTYAKNSSAPGLVELDRAPALVKTPAPATMTDEQLDTVLSNADQIRAFLKAVEEYAAGRYFSSMPLPGWKLVAGRSTRKWLENELEVAAYLKNVGVENPWRQSLLGITEIEKRIGKGKIDAVVRKSIPKPKLVSEDDKRQALPKEDATELLTALDTEDDEV